MISFIEQPNEWREFIHAQSQLRDREIKIDYEDIQNPTVLVSVSNRMRNVASLTSAFDLHALKHLNISFNGLKSIPPCFSTLSSLEHLDISHNKLDSLDFLDPLSSLRVLRANHNRLESIFPLACMGGQLEEIWINDNKLGWMEYAFLRDCENLRILIKQGNPSDGKIKLQEFLLYYLPNLQILDDKLITEEDFLALRGKLADGDCEEIMPSVSNPDSTLRRGSARRVSNVLASVSTPTAPGPNKLSTDLKVMITQAKAYYQQQSLLYQQRRSTSHEGSVDDDNASSGSIRGATNVGRSGSKIHRSRSSRSLPPLTTEEMGDFETLSEKSGVTVDTPKALRQRQRSFHSTAKETVPPMQQSTNSNRSASISQQPQKPAKENKKKENTPKASPSMTVYFPQYEITADIKRISAEESSTTSGRDTNSKQSKGKIAFCQFPSGEGYFRWQPNGTIGCRMEQTSASLMRMTATYPNGTSAAIIEMQRTSTIELSDEAHSNQNRATLWQLFDPQGRILCATSSSLATAFASVPDFITVYDPDGETSVLATYPFKIVQTSTNDEGDSVALMTHQWSFPVTVETENDGQVELLFNPRTGAVTVETSLVTLGRAVLSSETGMNLFPMQKKKENGHRRNSNGRNPSVNSKAVAGVGYPPRSSSSDRRNSQGRNAANTSEAVAALQRPTLKLNQSNPIRGGKGSQSSRHTNTSTPPDLSLLSQINANLDDLLGDIQQLKNNVK